MLPSGSRPFILPFLIFLLFLVLLGFLEWIFKGHGPLWMAEPRYWIFPLQTLVCGALAVRYWSCYNVGPFLRPAFTLLIAVLVLIVWVSPQEIFGFPRREDGFDPHIFVDSPALYWMNLIGRFVRLVVVVPIVEEVFWRGFLLRYLIEEDFQKVRFGAFTWSSFLWTSILFGFEHAGPDLAPAIVTGALFNMVAYRTRSLTACIICHAAVNLLLGLYILHTGQWGFW